MRDGGAIGSYFLTGATGVVGSSIVPMLLVEPDADVRLLIRAPDDAAVESRLGELVRFWGWAGDSAKLRRIKALRGDASLPRFGLSDAAFDELADACTHVIHAAGSVRMNLPLTEARQSAVASAQEVLSLGRLLADKGTLRKVEFVSTVGIAGRRSGLLPEAWVTERRAFHNSYEQAKSEAEEIVRRAVEEDRLPITTHRPSMVIGDARDGRVVHFQIFYYICEFLSGRRTFGIYPDLRGVRLDIIPSDAVAAAIVASSRDASTAGRIFHLCSGPESSPTLDALKSVVRRVYSDYGLRVPRAATLPRSWYARLARVAARLVPSPHRAALGTLPVYLDYLSDQQSFDNATFLRWGRARGLGVPDAVECLEVVLRYYLEHRYPRNERPS